MLRLGHSQRNKRPNSVENRYATTQARDARQVYNHLKIAPPTTLSAAAPEKSEREFFVLFGACFVGPLNALVTRERALFVDRHRGDMHRLFQKFER